MVRKLEKAKNTETVFAQVRDFYWNLIDERKDQQSRIGWKKGIYPSDEFIRSSLAKGEFYILEEQGKTVGCVILNSCYNEGYEGIPWSRKYRKEEVLIPHALAVDPRIQGKGIGRILVHEMINLAREQGMKAIRLDILGGNQVAERLYTGCGFQFVQEKRMFYEDTGWTQYRMYEYNLD